MRPTDCHQDVLLTSLCPGWLLQMEGMVKDLRLAREKQQQFEDWKSSKSKDLGIDLTVTVLTTGFWPTYKAVDLALPEEMVAGMQTADHPYPRFSNHKSRSRGLCSLCYREFVSQIRVQSRIQRK